MPGVNSIMVRCIRSSHVLLSRYGSTSRRPSKHSAHPPITLVCLSDTHNTRPQLPPGDILLHAGDFSQSGSFHEIQAQLTWLSSQPHKYKVAVAGNHDLLLDPQFVDRFPERIFERDGTARADLDWGVVIYLCDSAVTLDFDSGRKLKIWGSPWTQQFGNWAFQYPPIRDVWTNKIPGDTDVFLTHGPPLDVLDHGGKGNWYLLREIRRARPKAVVFGHVHAGFGKQEKLLDAATVLYEDLSTGRGSSFSLVPLTWHVVVAKVTAWFLSSSALGRNQPTMFVNAAVVGGRKNSSMRPAQVVEL
ncbi:phosphoric ester hydrolase [Aulographum hederae CBS 113979]|uniref:Phosphoric ester hydrolase n=1 Tax=Aulographum hederae CBS 113979 TaxID=1176131 RepID=A0A6G1GNQ9_9PEZI|nr:phosphoric ester hydrolase [Aulographum hederae CBS 113979]